jgi:transcriptional regulator with XRE-family HTH domain
VSRKFRDFMREMEAEARREGPQAVAELEAFDAHFRLAGEMLALRKARGLTQRQLAQKTGVNQSEISRIEGGSANPTMSTVAVLLGALGAELSVRAHRQGKTAAKRQAVATGRRATRATAARRVSSPTLPG